jgi:menaquinone-specific isochorismate synthase
VSTDRPDRLIATTVAYDSPEADDMVRLGGSAGARLWQKDGFGLVGLGLAERIELPAGLSGASTPALVSRLLGHVRVSNEITRPGTGPIVIGALPFDASQKTSIDLPEVVVGRDGTAGWLTVVHPESGSPDAALSEAKAEIKRRVADEIGNPPDAFSLVSGRAQLEWCEVVVAANEAIGAGTLEKVVLAREIKLQANRPFVVAEVLSRLYALYPSCMIFSVDGFVGASPEVLISRRGTDAFSHPLAGTVARSGDRHSDERLVAALMRSPKERREHQLVVKSVAEGLQAFCRDVVVPEVPAILELRNVSHLGTRIQGRLDQSNPASALDLVARLHPTPAVGGTPTAAALAFLDAHEGFDRGHYAGPVGWMDRNGDGDWAVGIRCAQIDRDRASLYAGVGVVAGSEPRAELAETQLKLQALLAAMVRP